MAREIIWTKRATSNFNKTIDYLTAEWGETVVTHFVRRSYGVIELLSERPLIGTVEIPQKQIRGFLITRHNRLFYRVTEREIILLNFYDTRSRKRKF